MMHKSDDENKNGDRIEEKPNPTLTFIIFKTKFKYRAMF